jgi:hypothetical protein
MVTGLWLLVGAAVGAAEVALVGAGVAAGAVLGLGVLVVELQALAANMVTTTIASALNLRLGFTVISSLTLMCHYLVAVLSELRVSVEDAIWDVTSSSFSSLCRALEGALLGLESFGVQPGGGVRRQKTGRQLGAG